MAILILCLLSFATASILISVSLLYSANVWLCIAYAEIATCLTFWLLLVCATSRIPHSGDAMYQLFMPQRQVSFIELIHTELRFQDYQFVGMQNFSIISSASRLCELHEISRRQAPVFAMPRAIVVATARRYLHADEPPTTKQPLSPSARWGLYAIEESFSPLHAETCSCFHFHIREKYYI